MAAYLALIHKEPRGAYGVSFPDFPGCVAAGATLDGALAEAGRALAAHIELMVEKREPLPPPSTLEEVMRERVSRDAVAVIVEARTRPARIARVNITLPEDVLNDIDAYAEREGYTRSGLIVKAALDLLGDFSLTAYSRSGFRAAAKAKRDERA